MDKFKSKYGASVLDEFALFNWSSVGYTCEPWHVISNNVVFWQV